MMPPLKPEVAVIDGKVWQFMGGAYHRMTADETSALIRKLQNAESQLRQAQLDEDAHDPAA